jgi:RNA polymerase sigma factor (sigma-70 family)
METHPLGWLFSDGSLALERLLLLRVSISAISWNKLTQVNASEYLFDQWQHLANRAARYSRKFYGPLTTPQDISQIACIALWQYIFGLEGKEFDPMLAKVIINRRIINEFKRVNAMDPRTKSYKSGERFYFSPIQPQDHVECGGALRLAILRQRFRMSGLSQREMHFTLLRNMGLRQDEVARVSRCSMRSVSRIENRAKRKLEA